MLPTLNGRIQSRILITLVIGGLWSLLVAVFLPKSGGAPYSLKLHAVWSLLIVIIALGVVWEVIYHGLMQFRWEKDWPTLFGLLTMINEGVVVYLVAHYAFPEPDGTSPPDWFHLLHGIPLSTFLFAFITTWIVVWLWANGPMRIFTVHWRFRGGRFV